MCVVMACAMAAPLAQAPRQPFSRVLLTVTPDHPDWTYQPGEPVTFRIDVVRDGHQVSGATVKYGVGPEMLPPITEATAVVSTNPLTVAGGTLQEPGFLRLVATAEIEGRTYRGVGTAGFAPDRIQPTQANPPDFDAFWDAERKRLAALPLDAKWTPLPDYGNADADCSQINLQNVGLTGGASRLYGILCLPRAAGKYPALLSVPGAGVRPYRGLAEIAGRGLITFQIGIHGIPVTQPQEVYRQPGSRRSEWIPDLRTRFARALLLPSRLHRNAARQRFSDVAAAVGRAEPRRYGWKPGRRAGDRHRRTRSACNAAGGVLSGALGRDRLPARTRRRLAAHVPRDRGTQCPSRRRENCHHPVLRRRELRPSRDRAGTLFVGLQRRDVSADVDVFGLQRHHGAQAPDARLRHRHRTTQEQTDDVNAWLADELAGRSRSSAAGR